MALGPAAGAAAAPAAAPRPAPALPTYFLDHDGVTTAESGGRPTPRLRLFREFVPTTHRTAEARAEAAANAVMREAGRRGHLNVWGERTVTGVVSAPGRIDVTVAGPTRRVDAATARLGVASVVWTVTATLGRDVPVVFRSADGQVLGGLPAGVAHRRATGVGQTSVLAAVWIDSPGVGGVVRSGRVALTGQACAFEGTVAYRVTRGTATVRSGVTTASIACPTRGAWRVDLGALPKGGYRAEVWAPSPADGQRDLGRVARSFTVG
ncbi:Gmad2 immunoglobulin-like domain-containing protein [Arsenicicoccus sp. oral taxon 190]|uniref:Gmad2 immunoglobulin-like domain-containing protein n=1 Tax=Arsenicicoccus sp. oral taxon 190 TaxID=1658671 RepID=UPI00067A3261|nr:Gmad2 immunoglobulin-like domain-containing protein [Arsenicicoccus sp. oral taxon 190]AKT52162.1 hypothetical protein ADJ73_14355 [Arsenicicoccus sp. oral taxon 190]